MKLNCEKVYFDYNCSQKYFYFLDFILNHFLSKMGNFIWKDHFKEWVIIVSKSECLKFFI